jgi:hypothetical protein
MCEFNKVWIRKDKRYKTSHVPEDQRMYEGASSRGRRRAESRSGYACDENETQYILKKVRLHQEEERNEFANGLINGGALTWFDVDRESVGRELERTQTRIEMESKLAMAAWL